MRTVTGGKSLYGALREVSLRQSGRIALVDGESRLTHSDLQARIDSLAAELQAAGVAAGDRVALLLPNGADFIASAFAVWKRRAVLVPLHVRYQEPEILRFVASCGVSAVLANSKFEALRLDGVRHMWIAAADGQWTYRGGERVADEAPDVVEVDADWPAVIQFSTGSTGTPKRVIRAHRQLVGELTAVAEMLEITPEDRALGAVPFFHSFGLGSVAVCPLLAGATLYALNDFFPRDVSRLIERERITGLPGVPFIYQMLADQSADLSSLRYPLSGGAPLSQATYDAFRSQHGVAIRQAYGSTETGMIAIELVSEPGHFTVGPPVPGVSIQIADEGRVKIVSPYAARGYDNVAGKSDSYFEDGAFFPGDVGSLTEDGRLILSGRTRQYINVAGNKVDPTEVESALREHPAIAEAVVVGVADGAAGEKLKAVLVLREPCTRQQVLAHCVTKLADFKRPRVIEFRDEIPKSPLGKILRKYLVEEEQPQVVG